MFKTRDESMEWALCVGILGALVWGIGLSLYGLHQVSEDLSWVVWGAQLIGGLLACLILPPAFVRGRAWVLAHTQQQPAGVRARLP